MQQRLFTGTLRGHPARRLYAGAPQQVRRQLLVRQQAIRSIAALDAAIHSMEGG